MSLYDFNPPTEEEIALLLGPEPEPEPPQEPESFNPNFLQRFMEGLAMQGGGQSAAPPRSFGQGFAGGLMGGLAQGGRRVAVERQRFEDRQAERQKRIDEGRLKAAESRLSGRRDIIRDAYKEHRGEKAKREAFDQENPLVTPELRAKYPAIGRIPDGERLDSVTWREVQQRSMTESPSSVRAGDAADRAAGAAQRQADAAERANRLAGVTSTNQLADDYRENKQIMAYTNVRSNLKTAEIAAKQANGVGDVALIFSYMRALEPDNPNVVREGDFKVARLAAGQLQAGATIPARFFRGDLLTEEGRQHFITQMRQSLEARREDFDLANRQYRDRAADAGINPGRFIREYPVTGSAGSRDAVDPRQFESP